MQNLIVLMEPSKDAENISWKGGRLFFNRFCIDEDAAFEISGVYDLRRFSNDKYPDNPYTIPRSSNYSIRRKGKKHK